MVTTHTPAGALADAVWQAIQTVPAVNHYDGEVPGTPPTDPDGRVHAYAVFYPAPGNPRARRMDRIPDTLDWTFQVTCVGGDRTRAMWCVDRIRGRLTGARVTIPAGPTVILDEVGDPGPLRRDETVNPVRLYLPLLYSTTAT